MKKLPWVLEYSDTTLGTRVLPWVLEYSGTTLGTRVLPWVLGYYLGYLGTTLGTRVLPGTVGVLSPARSPRCVTAGAQRRPQTVSHRALRHGGVPEAWDAFAEGMDPQVFTPASSKKDMDRLGAIFKRGTLADVAFARWAALQVLASAQLH
mgnify:CR=1 FL=1